MTPLAQQRKVLYVNGFRAVHHLGLPNAQALATVFSDDLFFPSIFDFDRQLGRPSSGVPAQRGIAIDVVEVCPARLAHCCAQMLLTWRPARCIQNFPPCTFQKQHEPA